MSLPSPFAAFLSQHARLLEITTALPDAALVVERFSGREAVNELFRFEIDCISTSAGLDLLALSGEEITLRLLQADGSKRAWHGYVTEALQLGADGGFARYRLIMEPWLALLRERRDSYVFQDKTVLEILGQLFADHPQANWAQGVTQELRRYSLSIQYRESDLDYCRRLLAEEGLSFRFSHDQNAVAGDEATHARHRLEIFDRETALPELAQPVLRFHRNNATEASDTVQTWQEIRNALPNAVTIAGWDYKTLLATGAEVESTLDNGEVPRMEVHDASLPYRYTDGAAARRHADLRLAAWEAAYRRFAGDSTVRQAAAGQNFTLSQHEEYQGDDARFTLLAVDHDGANNLGAQAARLLGSTAVEAGSYRNRLHAQPAALPVVPQPLPKPFALPQVALVVGVSGAPLTTERDHRVKIQFPWQRGEQPNPGGLAADAPGKSGNAPGNEQSGTWVRVTEWLAGPNWGSHFLPRIGTEVIVSFLDGDIDRPVIAGQIHNGADLPPFSAGHEASANHPGVLAGWMSHNFESGHNQWVIDDAPGQLRTRLAASDNASQLALGHLIHQAPESASRGAWRGSGFELRSDGWLAVRAGEGILISATARPNAVSTQMDIVEAVGQMRAAEETAKALSDAARAQQALPLNANAKQSDFITALDPQKDGKFTAPVGGQEAKKAQPGSRELGDPTERFNEPAIVAEAPGDIALSSPASTLLFAGAHLHATIQQDLHLAAAHTLAVTVGEAASWFSHAGGIKSIAEAGSHTLHAHTDQLEILADQSVTVTSSNDEIHILANQKIRLVGGQSSVTLEGANITFACPGTFSVKGSSNAFVGPGSGEAAMEGLPDSLVQIEPVPVKVKAKITSQTVATVPADRTRLQIGVGEKVNLTFNLGTATWTTTGGVLSSTNGNRIRVTAPDRATSIKITATGSTGEVADITFDIIEPSGVLQERGPGTGIWHISGIPSVGIRTNIYITPDTVSFENIEICEGDCAAVVTGYFVGTLLDGIHHAGHGAGNWVRVGQVTTGKGSKVLAQDTVQSGACNFGLPYAVGTFDWPIPWIFRVGSGTAKQFTVVDQRFTIDAGGAMTASKAGAQGNASLNDPKSNY